MKHALESVRSENFDVVQFEHIFMAQYQALFSGRTILHEAGIECMLLSGPALALHYYREQEHQLGYFI